jgi:hypothetical protein
MDFEVRGHGGIGIRACLRCMYQKGSGGSSPLDRTTYLAISILLRKAWGGNRHLLLGSSAFLNDFQLGNEDDSGYGPVVTISAPLASGTVDVPVFNREALIAALRTDQHGNSTFPEFLAASRGAGITRRCSENLDGVVSRRPLSCVSLSADTFGVPKTRRATREGVYLFTRMQSTPPWSPRDALQVSQCPVSFKSTASPQASSAGPELRR